MYPVARHKAQKPSSLADVAWLDNPKYSRRCFEGVEARPRIPQFQALSGSGFLPFSFSFSAGPDGCTMSSMTGWSANSLCHWLNRVIMVPSIWSIPESFRVSQIWIFQTTKVLTQSSVGLHFLQHPNQPLTSKLCHWSQWTPQPYLIRYVQSLMVVWFDW